MPPRKPASAKTVRSKSAARTPSGPSRDVLIPLAKRADAGPAVPRPNKWLVKSEPSEFSFEQLLAAPQRTTMWDGVRNYQARNTLRDSMAVGDEVFYYHSNADVIGIVGVARVASKSYPDPTQFERGHVHEDPGSELENPRWWLVDLQAVRALPRVVTLDELKANPALAGMVLLQRGSRLSVQPVSSEQWAEVLRMAQTARRS
jgi:predicted RNA-binding protein with PUA-like domain